MRAELLLLNGVCQRCNFSQLSHRRLSVSNSGNALLE